MNIVSNFIGSISPDIFSQGKGLTQNINLGDTTFADLLEKQLNSEPQNSNQNLLNSLIMSPDIGIGDTNSIFSQFNMNNSGENQDMLEAIKPVNESDSTDFQNMKNEKDMSTSEVVTFFNSLFDAKPSITDTTTSDLFEFEKKIAAGKYHQYAKNIITDLNEFVSDTMRNKLEN